WRTLHAGFMDVPTLRALEAALWGDTAAGGAVRLQVEPASEPQARLFNYKDRFEPRADFKSRNGLANRPDNRTTQGLFYVSYGMDEMSRQERRQRYHLEPGCRWRLRLEARDTRFSAVRTRSGAGTSPGVTVPADEVLTQARLALWLLCHLGGVGS